VLMEGVHILVARIGKTISNFDCERPGAGTIAHS
jgi:hypothetical protein